MKYKDRLTVIVFIILIIMILGLFIYNIYSNNSSRNIDRKIKYIFDNYTYQMVYTNGSDLFIKGIDLLINEDVLEYEKKLSGKFSYYSVDNCNNCKKIVNAVSFTNILTDTELDKYIKDNNIVKYENLYYLDGSINYEFNKKYVGSMIDIKTYDDNYVYFKSINYYCDNSKYLGLLDEEPSCNFNKKESTFKIKYENNSLRLDNLEELKNIVK